MTHGLLDWIRDELEPVEVDSVKFIYDDLESQSGRILPVIYQPFDPQQAAHWQDCGSIFDFLHSINCTNKTVLDFGPGDGWPALRIAPYVSQVTGVDGSAKRVQACKENATRMGIQNAWFLHTPPGEPIPFPDSSFDGVTAASSIEQTPDPFATLAEIFRVLRPGGAVRIRYEALNRYRGGKERALRIVDLGHGASRLIIYDRQIDLEQVRQYGLTYGLPCDELPAMIGADIEDLTILKLEQVRLKLPNTLVCTTRQPSGRTLTRWMEQIGFQNVQTTINGGLFARQLFECLPPAQRPASREAVEAYLEPIIKVAVGIPVGSECDQMISAWRQ